MLLDNASTAGVSAQAELGLKVFFNHSKKNVGNSKLVVFSSAISKDNPELREAKRNNMVNQIQHN